MPDPEMVSRAHRAAAALEQAWERWRIRHGRTAGPMPVSSYVGYSILEPRAHPRVVFGISADEAEILAALLDSHDSAGSGLGPEPSARPRPAENGPGCPQPAPADGAIGVPLPYQGSATTALPAGTAAAPGQPRPVRPAWADGAAQGEVAAAAGRSTAPGSRTRPRRPYTPRPIPPPRSSGLPAGPGEEPPATPGALATPGEEPPATPGALATPGEERPVTPGAPANGLLPAQPSDGPDASQAAGQGVPAPMAELPGEDERPTAVVEPVAMATPDPGVSGAIAAQLTGWPAGELPGQASA